MTSTTLTTTKEDIFSVLTRFSTRPVSGNNLIMEEEYGLYGVEGNGELQLFREEVNMTLPTAESDTFTIVNTTPIFPEEVPNQALIRESDELKLFLDDPANVDIYQFYASAGECNMLHWNSTKLIRERINFWEQMMTVGPCF